MNRPSVCRQAKYVASSSNSSAGQQAMYPRSLHPCACRRMIGCESECKWRDHKVCIAVNANHFNKRRCSAVLCLPIPFHVFAQKHCAQRLIIKLSIPCCMDILPQVERLLPFHAAAVVVVAVIAEDLRTCTKCLQTRSLLAAQFTGATTVAGCKKSHRVKKLRL